MVNRCILLKLLVSWLLLASGDAFSAGNRSPDRALLTENVPVHSPIGLRRRSSSGVACDKNGGLGKRSSKQFLSALQMNAMSSGGAQELTLPSKIRAFTQKNSFLLGMAMAVSFARAFPSVSQGSKWANNTSRLNLSLM